MPRTKQEKIYKEQSREDYKQCRTRNFATIVYEDSAPSDWQQIVANLKIPVFISPYHDRDVNPTGEPKKPHWHVIIMFDNVKSLQQAKNIFSKFNGVGCEVVDSIRGYSRYLCHLDNPEKAQYDTNAVISYGADYQTIIDLPTNKYTLLKEIINFIRRRNVNSFSDLFEYCAVYEEGWFRVICDSCGYIVSKYIISRSTKEQNFNPLIDEFSIDENGELVKKVIEDC